MLRIRFIDVDAFFVLLAREYLSFFASTNAVAYAQPIPFLNERNGRRRQQRAKRRRRKLRKKTRNDILSNNAVLKFHVQIRWIEIKTAQHEAATLPTMHISLTLPLAQSRSLSDRVCTFLWPQLLFLFERTMSVCRPCSSATKRIFEMATKRDGRYTREKKEPQSS